VKVMESAGQCTKTAAQPGKTRTVLAVAPATGCTLSPLGQLPFMCPFSVQESHISCFRCPDGVLPLFRRPGLPRWCPTTPAPACSPPTLAPDLIP
jgi:hypothetical protein